MLFSFLKFIDTLKRKNPEELSNILSQMQLLNNKLNDQAIYWLDAKEQLAMDAEMHNKMIANLVQFAQQQQQAPKRKH